MKKAQFNATNSARYQSMGPVKTWNKTSQGISGMTENGTFQITVYQSGVIRIQASRSDQFDTNLYSVVASPEEVSFSINEFSDSILLETNKLKTQLQLDDFTFSFLDLDGHVLNEDDTLGTAWIGTEITCYKKIQPEEKFIGLGEKTGNLNRFGQAYVNWNTDYFAYGIGDDPLYMSIPFYLGVHTHGAYGIYFDNTHKSVFNFGASNNRFAYFNAEDGDLDYYFIYEPSVSEIISTYTSLTGKMKLPPKWALGYQQCRYSYYPSEEVETLAKTFRDKKIPADIIYLDIHHMEKYKVFTFDGVHFPDPKSMIYELKKRGFKVVVILDPGIKKEEGYLPYEEGKSQGLFVKYPDGEDYIAQVWPGWCGFPDFTKEETRSWWAEKMAFYTEAGVDGFWTDMNEPASWGQFTPNLIEFDMDGNPASHRKSRNVYGMEMARATQEGSTLQNPTKRPFVLTRSGFAGVQRFAAAWTGDNQATEEHMLAGIRLVNSLGLSGVPFAGYDVGGFAGEASSSLFARWMSIGAFAPLYRAHSMINSRDAEPWAFGEEVEEISRNYIQLRYQLLPTLYSKFYKSSLDGLPIASSLAVTYPHEPKVYLQDFQNEYLFCDFLLVAPVESTKEITKVFLPKGKWYYLYTDLQHSGNQVVYQDCPINYLPVYAKAGSIIFMQSRVAHTAEPHDGILNIHLYQGDDGSAVLYEDEGDGFEYQSGKFYQRKMEYDFHKGEFKLEQVLGSYPSSYTKIKVYFHGFKSKEILINGKQEHLKSENYSFLDKITAFDPLPDNELPFFQIEELFYVEIEHTNDQIILTELN
ncbi:glycoside hydrolase family 31 protein [Algoriphagus lutimaris]|uniref:glycoside hydrolase family 31 protein n=1 Tax=Algoriphagus lutimaris TaxID=613197 RepID=UPI00196A7F83|nr:glycoside hydrolase family 31 protein [Algoriphagus lutimaris]MBN3519662.1 glycoside hydrolase family 31 protein [Algoriphagus lutimaris]